MVKTDLKQGVFEPKQASSHQKHLFSEFGWQVHKHMSFWFANVFICGAGAKRGGGVSGIPGRNAAMAVLEKLN